jgi:hypothetical protein
MGTKWDGEGKEAREKKEIGSKQKSIGERNVYYFKNMLWIVCTRNKVSVSSN